MTGAWWCAAPAKVNLCLFVGGTRPDDGRHELVTVMDNLSKSDHVGLTLTPDAVSDSVVCPGVEGPNLAADAITVFRDETGWDGPPVRVDIIKDIPIAGGMAGGSADAAATLRLLAAAAGIDDVPMLERLARDLGADVPSQIRGGRVLAEGAGERLSPLARRTAWEAVVVPLDARLSAGAVYAEFDRRGRPRSDAELDELRAAVLAHASDEELLRAGLLVNDLEPAAIALCPDIAGALDVLRGAGAAHAMVSGSGPTVVGFFPSAAAETLHERMEPWPGPWSTGPFAGPDFPRWPMPGGLRLP